MIPAALLACAPNVAPATLEAVIRVESGGNPLAINVNGLPVQPAPAATAAEAAQTAEGSRMNCARRSASTRRDTGSGKCDSSGGG